jgi:hypothetical protein
MFPAADSVLLRFLVPASMLFRLPVSVLFRFLFMLTVSVLFRFLFMFPDPVPVSELLRLFDANISDSSEVSEIFRFLDDDDDDKSELDFWFLIFWTIPNNFWKFEFLILVSLRKIVFLSLIFSPCQGLKSNLETFGLKN